MRFLSLFSGIEAASCAWVPLGWECVGVAEIEKFPSAVLAHHYPDVPNLGDITQVTEKQIKALGHVDLVVGGFPCQDLSVAGKRKGLRNDDGSVTRSGLFFDAMRIVRWSGARYVLLENVPGIYSSNRGRDFAAVVGEILGVEFGVPPNGWENTGVAASERGLLEWATLDAQWFGVAQRRRRMFALADFGDWRDRGPVLFERHSLSGHPAPRREAGEELAKCLTRGAAQRFDSETETMIPVAFNWQGGGVQTNLGYDPDSGITGSLHVGQTPAVALALRGRDGGATAEVGDDCAFSLRASTGGGDKPHVMAGMAVRRLTPRECERLQGFPDDYTAIPWKAGYWSPTQHAPEVIEAIASECPDGPRYKALGNSMAVPVMRWIGDRINQVSAIKSKREAA